MRRLRLNEDMVRRIEEALDERRQQRRGPEPAPGYPDDRRARTVGRRESDGPPPSQRTPSPRSRATRS